MKQLLCFLLFVPLALMAQETGIHFEHALSWQQIKEKARAENKFIFVDCFTTWCGPCRIMRDSIFPRKEVGDYFNDKFICVKMQMDSTARDAEDVRARYTDARFIDKEYNIVAYPTFLYFSPEGELVHRALGSSPAKEFIDMSAAALDPDRQYYTMIKKAQQSKDTAVLRKAAMAAADGYDDKNATVLTTRYLDMQPDLLTRDNISMIKNGINSSENKYFTFLLENREAVDRLMGSGFTYDKVKRVIEKEEFEPRFSEKGDRDFTAMEAAILKKCPVYGDRLVREFKIFWVRIHQDWTGYKKMVTDYMEKYGSQASADTKNDYAWTLFTYCSDSSCLRQALGWSKQSLDNNNNPAFMDTYANILYKLGKKEEAIVWEQKAIALVDERERKAYQKTADKMRRGEKTWAD